MRIGLPHQGLCSWITHRLDHCDQAIFRMAFAGLKGLRLACLAALCICMLNLNAVAGKKKSKSPEITNKVRKKLSR